MIRFDEYDELEDEEDEDEEDEEELDETDDGGVVDADLLKLKLFFSLSLLICAFCSCDGVFRLGYSDFPHKSNSKWLLSMFGYS